MFKKKSGQIAYELIIVFFFLSLSFLVWLGFSATAQSELASDRLYFTLEDLSLSIQHDLFLVSQMPDGFSKEVDIPVTILGSDFSFEIIPSVGVRDANFLVLSTDDLFYSVLIPPISGNLKHGVNFFTLSDGLVVVS